jgi:hypothetical protein
MFNYTETKLDEDIAAAWKAAIEADTIAWKAMTEAHCAAWNAFKATENAKAVEAAAAKKASINKGE